VVAVGYVLRDMNRQPSPVGVLKMLEAEIGATPKYEHSVLVADLMAEFASSFEEDPERWWLCGMLHDLDIFRTEDYPSRHGLASAEMLDGLIDDEIVQAIASHDHRTGLEPRSTMGHFIIVCDILANTTNRIPREELVGMTETDTAEGLFMRYFEESEFMQHCIRTIDAEARRFGMPVSKLYAFAERVRYGE